MPDATGFNQYQSWEINITYNDGEQELVRSTDGEGIAVMMQRPIRYIGTSGKLKFSGNLKTEKPSSQRTSKATGATSSTQRRKGKGDKAAIVQQLNLAVNGGIDLNRDKMQMNVAKEGPGVHMRFDQAMVARIKRDGFDGLDFEIERIIPVTNVPLLLGV